ncbi:MAG: fructose-1,6-bisphosphatase [Bacteroidaceae bacterium]|nr:fructose-1,6-bisphosphatase [Bacteroidaceae bacterium]MBP5647257.1 fructose-1,6-bisphosphatase [Bacteroidaceae bacterium]MBR4841964.1 fructose-1,6-bisphosphatase [Bacteroidaceae bacterium]
MERSLEYLQLLAKSFPSIAAASTEIINLEAILNLPKGTEHFVTDIHGEYDAFDYVLRSASGVIQQKIEAVFGDELSVEEKRSLSALISYPEAKLRVLKAGNDNLDEWYKVTLMQLIAVLTRVSSRYTRSKVRKALPKDYAYIIEELMHETRGTFLSKHNYIKAIVDTIVSTGRASHFITAIADVTRNLVIDQLHIIGDIYDRGPGAHRIMDMLCSYRDFDIQWGNHDVVWMGAASGSAACVANVVRNSLKYSDMSTLEDGYGINLLPLATFAMETYADDECLLFNPVKSDDTPADVPPTRLMSQMHKAIAIIQFKIEAAVIARHPEFRMEHRNLLDKMDLKRGVVSIDGHEYRLLDTNFPTIDPKDPYRLTPAEQNVIDRLVHSFTNSKALSRHMECLFAHGSLYLVHNNNLLYHGSVPLNEDGSFASLMIQGVEYKGRELFDTIEKLVRTAYFSTDNDEFKEYGKDLFWYLWCGPVSPPFDKQRMATFERYFIAEKETHEEKKGNYYRLKNRRDICEMILAEFGITDMEHAHIINGHIPVKAASGESPIKADGRLLVIDGGFSKVYHETTGIAGYTLIYNSHGMRLVRHHPFESIQQSVAEGMDVIAATQVVEYTDKQILVRDTDKGKRLMARVEDLRALLQAYRTGLIRN